VCDESQAHGFLFFSTLERGHLLPAQDACGRVLPLAANGLQKVCLGEILPRRLVLGMLS